MAESDYRRLAPACHCGRPTKPKLSAVGRPPKYCEDHAGPPPKKKDSRQIECPACRGFFTSVTSRQVYCSSICKVRHKRGNKPKDELRSYACQHCGSSFDSTHSKPMYCGQSCKKRAWIAKSGYRPESKPSTLCAYWSGYCVDCRSAIGGRVRRDRCGTCKARRERDAMRHAAEALHRASGRVICCEGCSLSFCPLYGASNAKLCSPCSSDRERESRRAQKSARRARVLGALVERVDPFAVFERDGWQCSICGVETPKSKRGTYEPDAPELDHIKPLSKGGEHSYANTQCACRRCNGLKSDRYEECEA